MNFKQSLIHNKIINQQLPEQIVVIVAEIGCTLVFWKQTEFAGI
jgi:hypothetical protein